MSIGKKAGFAEGLNEANITPLADVTTTLIVVFLITMPAIMWNGIQVNSAEASSEQQVVTQANAPDDELINVAVDPDGIKLNGERIRADQLEGLLTAQLQVRADKTVVVIPSDLVPLGSVVEVLDVAKASGAESLALLNEIGRRP